MKKLKILIVMNKSLLRNDLYIFSNRIISYTLLFSFVWPSLKLKEKIDEREKYFL